ncbi:MAG TPA: formate dehydrogenase subunit delta [Steroidobacteraceae bacterium]|nr:formate dehydrogenase subunit delta [Steroidobacteraceae bacterium]
MNIDHLVKMANEIGAFWEGEAGPKAPAEVASHLKRFWEPRMRQAIIAHYRRGGAGLDDVAREAVGLLVADAAAAPTATATGAAPAQPAPGTTRH